MRKNNQTQSSLTSSTTKKLLMAALFTAIAVPSSQAFMASINAASFQKALNRPYDSLQSPTSFEEPRYHSYRKPLWIGRHGLNIQAQTVLSLIHNADEHGLNPDRYGLADIKSLTREADDEPAKLAQLEQTISESVARYAQDLIYGATKASRYDRLGVIQERPALEQTINALHHADDAYRWLQSLAPASGSYKHLKEALTDYRNIQRNGGWPRFAKGKKIEPGNVDERVYSLAHQLSILGDYDKDAQKPHLYSGELIEAVKRFQTRHGLEPDGVIGNATQAALATTVDTRIDQIRASMERIRQLPSHLGDKFVLVNIPAFELTAYQHGKPVLEMNVVVGKKSRKTPLFSNRITQTVFNPTWTVPYNIATKDILRKAKKDPDYLVRGNYTVTAFGEKVDPHSVDWENVTKSDFPYRFRQAAGQKNALGKVKFPIPDNQSVYLHDTSHRELFAKDYRALSSGCIRLANPEAFAKYVLDGNEGWDEQRVASSLESNTRKTVQITPIPVHTVYWTAWVKPDGTLQFYEDIYNRDNKMLAALGPLTDEESIQLAAR